MDARCAAEILRCIEHSARDQSVSLKLQCFLGEMDWRTEAVLIARERGEFVEIFNHR